MTQQEILGQKVLLVFCLLGDFLLGGFLVGYLNRCWKRRTITLVSAYRSKKFLRDVSPIGYWLTFCGYTVLAALCIWGIVHIAYELSHGTG